MIRKLEKNDIPRCVELCKKCFGSEDYEYDIEKDFLAQSDHTLFQLEFYVFEENNIIKGVGGLSNCGFDDSVFGLFGCYVDPQFQGQGIGKALVEFRIARIKELGGEIIFSTTQKKRHLERFGFKEIDSPYTKRHLMQLIF